MAVPRAHLYHKVDLDYTSPPITLMRTLPSALVSFSYVVSDMNEMVVGIAKGRKAAENSWTLENATL